MKKLILAIVSVGLLLISNANADGLCQNWEHGQKIRNDQPNGYTAPKPYCWQVSDLAGLVNFNGGWYHIQSDDPLPVQGRYDSYYNFYGWEKSYAYGEMYYGIYVFVEVYGLPQNTPKVTLNHKPGILKGRDNVTSLSGNIINGTRYKFFIPVETVASAQTMNDLDVQGTIRIFDGVTLRRDFTIY